MSTNKANGIISPKSGNLTPQQRIEQLQNELVTTIKERDDERERCENIRSKVQKYRTQKEEQIAQIEDTLKKTTRLRDLYQKDLVQIRSEYRSYKDSTEARIKELERNLTLMTHKSNKFESECETLEQEKEKLQEKIDAASFTLPDILKLDDRKEKEKENDNRTKSVLKNDSGDSVDDDRSNGPASSSSPKPLSEQINWTPNKSKKLINEGVDMSEFACEQTENTEKILNKHTKILNEWKITSNILDSIYNLTNSSSIIDLSLNINLNEKKSDDNNSNIHNVDNKTMEDDTNELNSNVNKSERLFSKYLICKKLINQTHHRLESMQANIIALFDQRRELMVWYVLLCYQDVVSMQMHVTM